MSRNLKAIIQNNRIYNIFQGLPLAGKIGVGFGAFMVGGSILRETYSKLYNVTHFSSMHSGKESSMSAYTTKAMTDFGSGWQGLSKNITKLIGQKNQGLSSFMKNNLTAFTDEGVDLGKTMMKLTKKSKHTMHSIKVHTTNPVLAAAKNNSIGHVIA